MEKRIKFTYEAKSGNTRYLEIWNDEEGGITLEIGAVTDEESAQGFGVTADEAKEIISAISELIKRGSNGALTNDYERNLQR